MDTNGKMLKGKLAKKEELLLRAHQILQVSLAPRRQNLKKNGVAQDGGRCGIFAS